MSARQESSVFSVVPPYLTENRAGRPQLPVDVSAVWPALVSHARDPILQPESQTPSVAPSSAIIQQWRCLRGEGRLQVCLPRQVSLQSESWQRLQYVRRDRNDSSPNYGWPVPWQIQARRYGEDGEGQEKIGRTLPEPFDGTTPCKTGLIAVKMFDIIFAQFPTIVVAVSRIKIRQPEPFNLNPQFSHRRGPLLEFSIDAVFEAFDSSGVGFCRLSCSSSTVL